MTRLNRFTKEKEAELHNRCKDWGLTSKRADTMAKKGLVTHVLSVFRWTRTPTTKQWMARGA